MAERRPYPIRQIPRIIERLQKIEEEINGEYDQMEDQAPGERLKQIIQELPAAAKNDAEIAARRVKIEQVYIHWEDFDYGEVAQDLNEDEQFVNEVLRAFDAGDFKKEIPPL